MNKTTRRGLPVALTLAAGITSATLIFATPTLAATAEPGASMKQQTVAQPVHVAALAADNSAMVAKLAHMQASSTQLSAAAADYANPGGPATEQDLKIAGETGRIWYKQISSRKLQIDGKDTGWIARYDVQVRRADGKVLFDENLSVYRLAWFVNNFKVSKSYASDAAVVQALKSAAAKGEVDARATFKKRVGSLGEFVTSSGKTEKPYDFSQHPGSKYIPLNYEG